MSLYTAHDIFLGLDIGGTKVEGAVASLDATARKFALLSQDRFLVPHPTHLEDYLDLLATHIQKLISLAQINISDLKAIGIGLPGTIHPQSKVMLNGNTQYLIGVNVVEQLTSRLNKIFNYCPPLFVQNDANLFTLAESYLGVGIEYEKKFNVPFHQQVALGITLGTGVGGGLVSEGRILNGSLGSALEVGHISLNPQGVKCYCGQQGCAEAYLSGTALNKLNPFFDAKKLFAAAEENHAEAQALVKNYRQQMLHFLSILNNLFNPHYFVFGGGLSNQKLIFDHLQDELKSRIFLPEKYAPEILTYKLGESAGLFGAMVYAKNNLHS